MSTLSTRSKPPVNRPTSANLTPNGDDILDDNNEVIHERPPGKKVEKLRERKRQSREGSNVAFNYALTRMTNDRKMCMLERREAITKAEWDRNEQLALKKKKFEAEIMKLGLAGMNAMQQDYFQSLQNEIYEASKKSEAISTPDDPSTPFGRV